MNGCSIRSRGIHIFDLAQIFYFLYLIVWLHFLTQPLCLLLVLSCFSLSKKLNQQVLVSGVQDLACHLVTIC